MKKNKRRKFTRKMQKKLAVLFILILLALVGLNIRISYINAEKGDNYKKEVLSQQQYDSRSIPFKRGDILDRKGTVLATSEKVYNVVIDCKTINSKDEYKEPTIMALTTILGVKEDELRGILSAEETKESQYQVLLKEISMDDKLTFEEYTNTSSTNSTGENEAPAETTEAQAEARKKEKEEKQNVKGVWFEEDYKRIYPFGSLASNVLGFSNSLDNGISGIESYYDSALTGVNGREFGYLNEDLQLQRTIIEPENGNTLVSTIDYNVQKIIEKYIQEFNEQYKNGPSAANAGRGSRETAVIVADPNTGEIYGMATSDPYDLNNPQEVIKQFDEDEFKALSEEDRSKLLNEAWSNYCVSEEIEPGSTVKPMTIAAALETAAINGSESYYCDGYQQLSTGERINCVYTSGHGTLTVEEVLMHSCNDGIMQIAETIGISQYAKYQEIYNIGQKTGIDLPEENTGTIYTSDTMTYVDLLVNSFGQSFTCTMIQETAAFASVINGGYYYQPHVVKQELDDSGRVINDVSPNLLRQTISSKTSATLREYMYQTVENGTGKTVQVPGYTIGGKTGTAEKRERDGEKYLVSFIGFAPVENPEVVVYVVIDEPNVENQADSQYAQVMANGIFSEILPYLNIFPTEEIVETGDTNSGGTSDEDADAENNSDENSNNDEDADGGQGNEAGQEADNWENNEGDQQGEDGADDNAEYDENNEIGASNPDLPAPPVNNSE